jgi:hypothetical protein
LAYGNWNKSPYNTTPRQTAEPGVGAEGDITGAAVAGRDYDGVNPLTSPLRFAKKPTTPDGAQVTGQIHYPFDHRVEPDLEDLRLAAQQQGNYYGPGGRGPGPGGGFAAGATPDISSTPSTANVMWPDNSTVETVVFVRFASWDNRNKVRWNIGGPGDCSDTVPRKGTLVVENGEFTMAQNTARLNGVVIIRGVPTTSDSFTQGRGRTCLEGPVNTSGRITIAGNVSPFTLEGGNRPGFYSVQMRSWRELYQ